jgi:hypothetical protein
VPARTAAIRVRDRRFRRGGVRVFTAGEPVGRIDMAVFSGGQWLAKGYSKMGDTAALPRGTVWAATVSKVTLIEFAQMGM